MLKIILLISSRFLFARLMKIEVDFEIFQKMAAFRLDTS